MDAPHDSRPRRRRRWYLQFSIRGLLMLTAATGIGLWGWKVNRQRVALRTLEQRILAKEPDTSVDDALKRVLELRVGSRAAWNLVALVDQGDTLVQEQAGRVLRQIGAEAIPALTDALSKRERVDTVAAILTDVGGDAVTPLLEIWDRELNELGLDAPPARDFIDRHPATSEINHSAQWWPLLRTLTQCFHDQVQHSKSTDAILAAAAAHRNPQVRLQVICALVDVYRNWQRRGKYYLDGVRLLDMLVGSLSDDASPYVRGCAAQGLGRLGWTSAAQPLTAALRDPDPYVRLFAAEALIAIGGRRVGGEEVANASRLLTNIEVLPLEYQVRVAKAVAVLDRHRFPLLWPTLEKALDRGGEDEQRAVVAAIAAFRASAEPAIPALIRHARTDSTRLALQADLIDALPQISGPCQDRRVEELLVELAADGDREVYARASALRGLSEFAKASQRSVDALLKALAAPDSSLRINAAFALGEVGPRARPAIPLLKRIAEKDSSDAARRHAAAALQKIGGRAGDLSADD